MKFFYTCKVPSKNDYSVDDSFCDFLLYYNDRLHSTTKVDPFEAIMDASDKELMEIKKSILKRKLKAKTVSETYSEWQLYQSLKLH